MSKIKDLQRYISQKNKRLIPDIPADILEFIDEYNTYGMIYDAKLQDYAGLTLLDVEEMNDEAFEDIQQHIKMMLFMNKYKYNELYKTLFYEYNPLNNTEWKETQTFGKQVVTDENGERNTDNVYGERGSETVSLYGEQSQTNSNGKREQTSDHGAQQLTDVIASRTNSDAFGEQTHTDASAIDKATHKSNGYDSIEGVADGEDQTNIGQRQRTDSEYTNSQTVGGGTDTHSSNAYVDKVTDAAVIDTVKNEQHEDTVTNTAESYTDSVKQHAVTDKHTNDEYTNTIERAGNIGITTSAQLIREQRGIVDWSFWEVLYNDIIDEICLAIW